MYDYNHNLDAEGSANLPLTSAQEEFLDAVFDE